MIVNRASFRAWPYWMLATIIVLLTILEVWYRTYPFYRHPVDYKISVLNKLYNKNYEHILLSDSVTATPLRGIELKSNILDMTTNQAISLAGNFFILNRYLKQNAPPKELYLFFIPDLLKNNLDNPLTYSYFETVFNNPDEIQSMKLAGQNKLYQNTGNFFEKRFESINFFKHYKFKSIKLPSRDAVLSAVKPEQNKILRLNDNPQILNKQIEAPSPVTQIFLKKLLDLCKQRGIKMTLVLEPLPSALYVKWSNSSLKTYIQQLSKNNEAKIIDINAIYNFPDSVFSDGIHLKKKWANFYVYLINDRIVKILPAAISVQSTTDKK